jgi:DNA-binding beta-propeller fold protein YncE
MIINRLKLTLPAVLVTVTVVLAVTSSAQAATAPIKEIEASHFGWEVNKNGGDICTAAEAAKCQPGKPSGEPGGFEYPEAVAAAPGGNVFVAERGNHRVQELEADGKFVLMFGRKVNKQGGDLCIAAEVGECQAGEEGTAPGQFTTFPQSIAVDPLSGNVYVAEHAPGGGERVQEFTPTGQFVLEIGRKVNTKGGNLCTAAEVANCTAPERASSPEPGAFHYQEGMQNMLAVGGPEDLLYVGDEHRVQEFDAKTGSTNGQYKREIPLTSISAEAGVLVSRIAVNATGGEVYLVYAKQISGGAAAQTIDEFDATGTQVATFQMEGFVLAIAVDPAGRLAVSESANAKARGTLYEDVEVKTGVRALHVITRFVSRGAFDLTFNGKDEMFAAFQGANSEDPASHEVISWEPVPVGELAAGASACVPGSDIGTDATLDCELKGEVDPWGVSETEVWFQWGRTPVLGEETPKQPIANTKSEGEEETPVPVSAAIKGVRPNEPLYDQLAGEDHNVKAPELLSSLTSEFTTPLVPPRVVGEPIAAFQTATSSVFFGRLNPENTLTSYEFQYAPEEKCDKSKLAEGKSLAEACAGVLQTSEAKSSQYGPVGTVMEGASLQPATLYRYRLYAVNEKGQGALNETGGAQLPEGTFETAPAPAVQAQTGGAIAIGTTSAVVSGTVNPDGQASTYTFELGVYNGAATRYGIVFSGPAGAGSEPVQETLAVSGLQPGTVYAYRISIHFGDGSLNGASATGASATFTTGGLPAVLLSPAPLAQLSIPAIAFPKEAKVRTVKALTRAQKLANALRACKKKPRKQRAACQKQARKKYPKSKQANNRKKG